MRPTRLLGTALAAIGLLCLGAAPAAAQQRDLIVQSTTSVRDSGVLDALITPMFEKAYPQYRLKFIAVGTGQAMTNARAGQADALIAHSPPLEKQFIDDGYSYEPTPRLFAWNDFVIVGPASDPAGVLSKAPHDAVAAMQAIAAAGAAGRATFISRGDKSGTNTKELRLWGMSSVAHDAGDEPIDAGGAKPAWYQKAGLGMGDTLRLAQQCPFTGGCYTIVDRGTLQNLVGNRAVTGLKIVMDGQSAAAPGGADLMLNVYHLYAINPAKYPTLNLQGALSFMDFLTSKSFQNALATYPTRAAPGFFPAAFPRVTLAHRLPRSVSAARTVRVTGRMASAVPGAAPLAGLPVSLADLRNPLAPIVLDQAKARASGAFSVRLRPTRSGRLFLTTPRFGDLSPVAYPLGSVRIHARVTIARVRARRGGATISGRARPGADRRRAVLSVLGRQRGRDHFSVVRRVRLRGARTRYTVRVHLRPGRWQLKARYADRGIVASGTSRARSLSVR